MNINNGANALKTTNSSFKKFEIKDVEDLITKLGSLRTVMSKDMLIFNIEKYGYKKQQEYILQSLGYSINNKKIKVSKSVIQQSKLFEVLFEINKDCFISLINKETGQIRSYNVQVLKDPYRLQAILKSKYFNHMNDMMYSLNAYNNMYRHNKDTLFSLQNVGIDVDFDTKKYTIKEVLKIIKNLYMKDEIPVPNAVEYGHRIRLIYSIQDVPATKKSIRLFEKIAKEINSRLPKDIGSSVQPLTTYARLIGSVNTKNNSIIKAQILNPNKYVLKELQEKYLDVPDWLKKVKKANKNIIGIQNTYTLNLARLRDLQKIQSVREEGYKECLCYLYRNYCLLSGMSVNEAWEKTIEFNSKFKKPKRINKLNGETKTLNRKQYLHKSTTILELLDITPKEEIGLKLETIISSEEYKRRENVRGKTNYRKKLKEQGKSTKKEQIKEIREKIKSLKTQGFKNKEIAQMLSLPTKTLERHITHLKKTGLL